MKEQVLLYGVCAAISIVAVALTSLIKIIVCAIAQKYGKDISGNVKEYVFTPIAIIIAGLGCYFWVNKVSPEMGAEQFILTIAVFSLATMLIYLMLFQSTRKIAVAIFNAIVQKKGLEPVVDAVQSVIGGIDTAKDTNSVEDVSKEKNNLQSSANYSSGTAQDAAANLQAMVEKIKKR